MKPIEFPEATKQLQPSGKEYSENVIAVKPLPIWTDGEQCVSKWRLSWLERLAMLFRGSGAERFDAAADSVLGWQKILSAIGG